MTSALGDILWSVPSSPSLPLSDFLPPVPPVPRRGSGRIPAERRDDPTRRTGGSGGKSPPRWARSAAAARASSSRSSAGPGRRGRRLSCSPAPKGVAAPRRSWVRAPARVVRFLEHRRIASPLEGLGCERIAGHAGSCQGDRQLHLVIGAVGPTGPAARGWPALEGGPASPLTECAVEVAHPLVGDGEARW